MPKQLKIALAAAVLLVLFMSAQGTAALWRAEATIDAGAVKTGNLHLLAGNSTKAEENYAFTELDGSNLVPGEFTQAPLAVTNGGTTDLAYNLTNTTTLPAFETTSDIALATYSVLTIKAGLSAAECNARNNLVNPLYKGPADARATLGDDRFLAADDSGTTSEILCVRVEIPEDTPQSASGGRLQLVLNFQGQQQ